jgi:N,N'-diacetylchitobiose transport system substrate-binding protein
MYLDGPWATAQFAAISTKDKADWAMFPLPGQNGGLAPVFSGGSDLGVWATTKSKDAAWDLVQTMDAPASATSFATAQNFYPPFRSQLSSAPVTGNPYLAALAKAASGAKISPLNSKNWPAADDTDLIIPTMIKSLEQGANFTSTVNSANTHLQDVLNTGQG